MPSSKLTREKIIDAALELTERGRGGSFSLRELAQSLDVKAASLYNHFAGLAQIQEECAVAEGGGEGVHIVQHPPVEALHIFLAPGDVVWILLEVLAVKGGQGDHAVHPLRGEVPGVRLVHQPLHPRQQPVQILDSAVVLNGVVGEDPAHGRPLPPRLRLSPNIFHEGGLSRARSPF